MTKPPLKRCAIYTRKSSEEGLEQDFNSLHAQQEASAAYIASQKHEGWQIVKTAYDDGGFSGGNMERPALKQLLADITAGKIDVIMVYKVDRLSRSLHDFARMVEIFDKHGVSFVSVTQQFNTTTSMGRLTLNVLLSFAQFEREVTGERIRDKIAASKKKGMWMGGFVPLGYDVVDRKLVINAQDAKIVRDIFQRYLDLGCVRLLQNDLSESIIRSKLRGNILSRGTLYKMLSNPIYIGKIRHKEQCHLGLHEAIIDQVLWNQVQQRMQGNTIGHKTQSRKTEHSLLAGKLFDVSGERLVPIHANKKGRRYRYYVSQSLTIARADASASGWRLPGQEIEQTVLHITSQLLLDRTLMTTALQESGIKAYDIPAALNAAAKVPEINADALDTFIKRVELRQDGIRLTLSLVSFIVPELGVKTATITHDIPMLMKRRGVEMRLVIGGTGPMRKDTTLIRTIVRAHTWLQQITSGQTLAEIAKRDGVNLGDVSRMLNLAFFAPGIVDNIIAGKQPADLSAQKLLRRIDLPLEWAHQAQLLGFA